MGLLQYAVWRNDAGLFVGPLRLGAYNHADQFAGLLTGADEVTGAQIGAVNITKSGLSGASIGVANIADDVKGVQIGLVNRAARLRGVQIGLVNLSGDGGLPFFPVGNIGF